MEFSWLLMVQVYLNKEDPKIYINLVTRSLSSADISIFHQKLAIFHYVGEYRKQLHFHFHHLTFYPMFVFSTVSDSAWSKVSLIGTLFLIARGSCDCDVIVFFSLKFLSTIGCIFRYFQQCLKYHDLHFSAHKI